MDYEVNSETTYYYWLQAMEFNGSTTNHGPVSVYVGSTLPVELSSFAATLTAYRYVNISWVTELETNLAGFQIFRNTDTNMNTATPISLLIEANNTSTTQSYSYIDTEIPNEGATYYYWLRVVYLNGSDSFHGPTSIIVEPVSNDDETQTPALQVLNLYPNPFSTHLNIEYSLKNASPVEVQIYNLKGQRIRSWNAIHQTGKNSLEWDGRDSTGKQTSSGIYLLRISTPDKQISTKLLKLQ